MRILNENEFRDSVEEIFVENEVDFISSEGKDRKATLLRQELFFDLHRTHHKHAPDVLLTSNRIPCELKSPKEIYDVCRYSRAHFCSYILQIIFGQCLSYADMFRPNDAFLSIFLVIPKIIRNDLPCFGDIEDSFSGILKAGWPYYLNQMSLTSVTFEAPDFVHATSEGLYGSMGNQPVILVTKINYLPNYRLHTDPS